MTWMIVTLVRTALHLNAGPDDWDTAHDGRADRGCACGCDCDDYEHVNHDSDGDDDGGDDDDDDADAIYILGYVYV